MSDKMSAYDTTINEKLLVISTVKRNDWKTT